MPPQQRYAAARSTVPSRKSATDAAIQQLSPVSGSVAAVTLLALGLEDVDTVVLVTVVVVLVVAPRVSARDLPWALWWALRRQG